jgi:tetratricopeptide (TPR) repeat protein
LPSRLGIAIPISLFIKLGFADCVDHPKTYYLEGLLRKSSINIDVEFWGEMIEGPHQVLSQAFLNESMGIYGITDRYYKLIERISADSHAERRFFLLLLRRTSQIIGSENLVRGILKHFDALVSHCRQNARVWDLSIIWPEIYRYIGQRDEADKCSLSAIEVKPISSNEMVYLAKLLTEKGYLNKALVLLQAWIDEGHNHDAHAWSKYLELIARKPKNRHPTREEYIERQKILQELEQWLVNQEPPLTELWIRYLQLADQYGTGLHRVRALDKVAKRLDTWREKFPNRALQVFEKYLSVLDSWRKLGASKHLIDAWNRGASEAELNQIITRWIQTPRIHRALTSIPDWIHFSHMLPQSLDFTVHWGADHDWRAVSQEVISQINRFDLGILKNPQKIWDSLITSFLKRGNESDAEELMLVSRTMLLSVLDFQTSWWIIFLKLLWLQALKGSPAKQSAVQQILISIVSGEILKHRWESLMKALKVDWDPPPSLIENETILSSLGSLLYKCPVDMITVDVCAQYEELCRKCPNFSRALILHLLCANLLARAGKISEASKRYESLLNAGYTGWVDLYYHYALLNLSQSSYEDAEHLLRKGLKLDSTHMALRIAFSKALKGQGKTEEAEREWLLIRSLGAIQQSGD